MNIETHSTSHGLVRLPERAADQAEASYRVRALQPAAQNAHARTT